VPQAPRHSAVPQDFRQGIQRELSPASFEPVFIGSSVLSSGFEWLWLRRGGLFHEGRLRYGGNRYGGRFIGSLRQEDRFGLLGFLVGLGIRAKIVFYLSFHSREIMPSQIGCLFQRSLGWRVKNEMQLSGITPTGSAVNFAEELHRGKANLAVNLRNALQKRAACQVRTEGNGLLHLLAANKTSIGRGQ
jgi:hypothetical protein